MPLSHDHKLLMVHIPKNAGTAIEKCLNMTGTGHFKWSMYAQKHPLEWKEYKSFSVLRDPLDRFVSAYNYATMEKSYWHSTDPNDKKTYGKHIDYDTCVKYDLNSIVEPWLAGEITLQHPSWWTQHEWINDNGSVAVNYLASFNLIGEAITLLAPNAKLEKINASTSKKKDQLTDQSKKLLLSHYDTDADLYAQLGGEALAEVSQ